MPGNLAKHLQAEMKRDPPRGWAYIDREKAVLHRDLSAALGYTPAADLVIESKATRQRIWIELEISRADPVANHAKFAVAHLVDRFDGTFVAMMSPHVVPGRRRLAAHTVAMMRKLDMEAFQTTLFPQLTGDDIKALNHMPTAELRSRCPPAKPEWQRVLSVVKPFVQADGHRILFVGDPAEVRWNAFCWNRDLSTDAGRRLWGGVRGYRVVEHFVWSPSDNSFAPCKFVAFVPAGGQMGMSMGLYARLDEDEPRFDGRRAWKHLERVGFSRTDSAAVLAAFRLWMARWADVLRVKRDRPVIWQPPAWARG